MKLIYLDNAATTATDIQVLAAMKPYFIKDYGNPSEPHFLGQQARLAVEESRETVSQFLRATPSEIIFTSCATESINLAHKGLIESFKLQGMENPHIITTQIEHKAVLETCKSLERDNLAKVTYLPVDKDGLVKVDDIKNAILPETVLVSVMYVNNEVGTIQPIAEIGKILRKISSQPASRGEQSAVSNQQIYFHTDATQAIQYLNCNVNDLGVDLLSFTGHKFGAPKGIGALYKRTGVPLIRQQEGGSQEGRLRAGTENVPYIVGLGKALEGNLEFRVQNSESVKILQERLITSLLKLPGVKLTGHPKKRVSHIASFIVEGVEGEALVLSLSNYGIMASSGSACTAAELSPSHVLSAMGIPPEQSHGSVRFSLGKNTTQEEIDYVCKIFPKVVENIRKMAPKL